MEGIENSFQFIFVIGIPLLMGVLTVLIVKRSSDKDHSQTRSECESMLEIAKSDNKALTTRVDKITNQMDQMRIEHAKEISRLRRKYNKELKDLNEKVSDQRELIAILRERLDNK